jgi:hypothetical protein
MEENKMSENLACRIADAIYLRQIIGQYIGCNLSEHDFKLNYSYSWSYSTFPDNKHTTNISFKIRGNEISYEQSGDTAFSDNYYWGYIFNLQTGELSEVGKDGKPLVDETERNGLSIWKPQKGQQDSYGDYVPYCRVFFGYVEEAIRGYKFKSSAEKVRANRALNYLKSQLEKFGVDFNN